MGLLDGIKKALGVSSANGQAGLDSRIEKAGEADEDDIEVGGVECPDCGLFVGEEHDNCPGCGFRLRKEQTQTIENTNDLENGAGGGRKNVCATGQGKESDEINSESLNPKDWSDEKRSQYIDRIFVSLCGEGDQEGVVREDIEMVETLIKLVRYTLDYKELKDNRLVGMYFVFEGIRNNRTVYEFDPDYGRMDSEAKGLVKGSYTFGVSCLQAFIRQFRHGKIRVLADDSIANEQRQKLEWAWDRMEERFGKVKTENQLHEELGAESMEQKNWVEGMYDYGKYPQELAYLYFSIIRFLLTKLEQHEEISERRVGEKRYADYVQKTIESIGGSGGRILREGRIYQGQVPVATLLRDLNDHRSYFTQDEEDLHAGWATIPEKEIFREVNIPKSLFNDSHKYVVGITGSGKTVFLTGWMIKHMERRRSPRFNAAVLDIHGDITQDLKKAILFANGEEDFDADSAREFLRGVSEDLVILDFGEDDRLPGINLLAPIPGITPNQQANTLVSVFKHLYPKLESAERIPRVIFMVFLTMIKAGKYTLLEIPTFINNESFRQRVIREADDASVEDYFYDVFPKDSRFAEGFISRLQPFVYDDKFKRVFGQSKSTIDFADILNRPRMLIIHAPKGKLGEAREFLCSLVLNMFLVAAFGRADLPENERYPYHLYLDEFQNYANMKAIETILTETRKYNVFLTMAHQNLSQSNISASISNVIRGNATIQSYFCVSGQDAPIFAKDVFNDPDPQLVNRMKSLAPGISWLKIKRQDPLLVTAENIREEIGLYHKQNTIGNVFEDEEQFEAFIKETFLFPWSRSAHDIDREINARKRQVREGIPDRQAPEASQEAQEAEGVDIDKMMGL